MSEAKIKDLRINKGLTKQQLIDSTVITENELSFVTDDTVVDVPAPTEAGKVLTSTEDGVEWAEGGSGTSDYNQLSNKPQIENITLSGNNSLADLGIASVNALSNKLDKTTAARKLYGTNASGEQVRYDLSHFAAAADLDPLVIQWPVLPEPTASLEGVVYEYVGETNSTYTNGYFYKCVGTSVTVEAVSSLPAASAQEAGKIYRYVGETNSIYTKNNYYKCTSDGLIADDWSNTEYEKFSWKEVITDTSSISTVSELPAASAQELGNVYKQGNKYYKCTSFLMAAEWGKPEVTAYKWSELETLNVSDSTYAWEQLNVQPGGSSLPSQTGQSGKFLTTDGTNASWAAIPSEIDDNSTSATATWSASKINSMIGNVESLLAAI